jgi:hypothetical protein
VDQQPGSPVRDEAACPCCVNLPPANPPPARQALVHLSCHAGSACVNKCPA